MGGVSKPGAYLFIEVNCRLCPTFTLLTGTLQKAMETVPPRGFKNKTIVNTPSTKKDITCSISDISFKEKE